MFDRNAKFSDGHSGSDILSELLIGMRLRGARYGRLRLAPPFGIHFGDGRAARFHFVARGDVRLEVVGHDALWLHGGHAVLIPTGRAHRLVSAEGEKTRDFDSYRSEPLCLGVYDVLTCPDGVCSPTDTNVFTGEIEFDLDTLHPLVELMPAIMPVATLLDRQPEILPLLAAMEREMAQPRAGSAGILARLADVVAASIVRGWIECGCGQARGWVEALRDPRVGRVIAALHRDPERAWTVMEMAQMMGASRSAFAERFASVTGSSPQKYVTALRMQKASKWIARDGMPISIVADRLGYGSQAAFARAFKRATGQPPGKMRSQAVLPPVPVHGEG
ncbi:AraC family transcriptional regulator [Shinella sp. HY16]|nr:AraC family transcriptional regulator [Shinella sp. YE25]MDC7266885.1 AraC family transcriptional regulator [Shinella sp. HY16]MDC7273782.1 AraC family transcriptional regulator [Shinella sp. YZ44]